MSDQKPATKTHKEVALFIKYMAQFSFSLQKAEIRDDQTYQMLYQQLKLYHISLIVALHQSEILFPFLQGIIKQLKTKTNNKQEKLIQFIYRLGHDCLFQRNEAYIKLFKGYRNKFKSENNGKYPELSKVSLFRYYDLTHLLFCFWQIKESQQQSIPQLKQLQSFINQQIKYNCPLNAYQESFLGWLKESVESFQKSVYDRLKIVTNSLCCRFYFLKNQNIQYVQTTNLKFMQGGSKKFEYIERKQFLKRAVISYLNSFGGTIYFGIDYGFKNAKVVGVQVSKAQKLAFLKFLIEELVFNIFPYGDELKSDANKELIQYRQKKWQSFQRQCSEPRENQYILTDYISVEFINIHQNSTLMFSRSQQDEILYVVKVNVRPGNQYNLYHLINEKDTPEAYILEGKKQRTLYFKDYYEEMYRRLKAMANNKRYDKGKSPVHLYCRSFRNLKQKREQNAQSKI